MSGLAERVYFRAILRGQALSDFGSVSASTPSLISAEILSSSPLLFACR
jgi:hypothetical protein